MSTETAFKVYAGIPAAKMNEALAVAKLNNLQLLSFTVTGAQLSGQAVVNLARLLPGQVIVDATGVTNDAITFSGATTIAVGCASSATGAPSTALITGASATTFAVNDKFAAGANTAPYVVQAGTEFLNVRQGTSRTVSADGSVVINVLISNSAVNA
jgi:hypothetical protein